MCHSLTLSGSTMRVWVVSRDSTRIITTCASGAATRSGIRPLSPGCWTCLSRMPGSSARNVPLKAAKQSARPSVRSATGLCVLTTSRSTMWVPWPKIMIIIFFCNFLYLPVSKSSSVTCQKSMYHCQENCQEQCQILSETFSGDNMYIYCDNYIFLAETSAYCE
jgi:hypothetical protein